MNFIYGNQLTICNWHYNVFLARAGVLNLIFWGAAFDFWRKIYNFIAIIVLQWVSSFLVGKKIVSSCLSCSSVAPGLENHCTRVHFYIDWFLWILTNSYLLSYGNRTIWQVAIGNRKEWYNFARLKFQFLIEVIKVYDKNWSFKLESYLSTHTIEMHAKFKLFSIFARNNP